MKLKLALRVCLLALTLTPGLQAYASGAPSADELPEAKCEKDFPSFEAWRADFKREALAAGVTQAVWKAALPQMTFDASIIQRDRKQGGFYKNFLDFSVPRAHPRIAPARLIIKKYAETFAKIEKDYGVSPYVIIAFWGMETDFATKPREGLTPVLRSMATLAFDCRRAALFRQNLLDGLKLVQNGDIALQNFNGEWAGEMSGLQFTPSNYLKYGVDYDGDGKRDLVNSVPDMIATAANMFKDYGWTAGVPFLMEVKVPDEMPWEQADMMLVRQQPMSYWVKHGVTGADGASLSTTARMASLLLPMGRFGPSFLAFDNYKTLQIWNASSNNALTAGYLATRLKNPKLKPMSSGKKTVEVLTSAQMKELQTLLAARGFEMGKIDGFLGNKTRESVREMQLKFKMPADGYPTSELLIKLRK